MKKVSNRIMKVDLKFPSEPHISAEAKDLISKVSGPDLNFHAITKFG